MRISNGEWPEPCPVPSTHQPNHHHLSLPLRIFYNNRSPFFAFVGVSLASGSVAIITKDDELEGMCWEIRETVSKMHQSREDIPTAAAAAVSLDDLELGPSIGKGCSAVVYAAAWKAPPTPADDLALGLGRLKSHDDYPLALKMMFNYDIQSNALLILRAMYRETLPARISSLDDVRIHAAPGRPAHSVSLPPHANIVTMYNAFCDQIPSTDDGSSLYPSALPPRLHADGYGRNMSLFLVMKRYNFTLERFLQRPEVHSTPRMALLLFAQLLEAVAHLYRHGVSHRDLKADNILVERHAQCPVPLLVVNDFGCCLADRLNGFVVPYPTEDMDRGGNAALMAPEIITKQPGPFAVLDYTKADLWAAGSIAYEIFGQRNPFADTRTERSALRNYDYVESELPRLGENCPVLVQRLIENMLRRNPKKVRERVCNCSFPTHPLAIAFISAADSGCGGQRDAVVPVGPLALAESGGAVALQ